MCVSRRCVVICGVCDGQSLPKDEEWNGLEIEEWIIRVVIVWCVCAAVGRKAPTPHSNHNHHPTTRYYNSHAVDQNVRLIQIYFELNVLLSHFIHIHILHIRIYYICVWFVNIWCASELIYGMLCGMLFDGTEQIPHKGDDGFANCMLEYTLRRHKSWCVPHIVFAALQSAA